MEKAPSSPSPETTPPAEANSLDNLQSDTDQRIQDIFTENDPNRDISRVERLRDIKNELGKKALMLELREDRKKQKVANLKEKLDDLNPNSMRYRRLSKKLGKNAIKLGDLRMGIKVRNQAKELRAKNLPEGFKTLRDELESIDQHIEDRKQNRERYAELTTLVDSGELGADDEEYNALNQYFESIGDETDEQYRDRLRSEVVKKYDAHLEDKENSEKEAKFQGNEKRLVEERLAIIDKVNNPSVPIKEREKLLREVAKWSKSDSLIDGDSGEFREWLRKNAQRDWVNAFQAADREYQGKLQMFKDITEEIHRLELVNNEVTERINQASTDEEKETLQQELRSNNEKIDKLQTTATVLPQEAKKDFDRSLFSATELFHRRQRIDGLLHRESSVVKT